MRALRCSAALRISATWIAESLAEAPSLASIIGRGVPDPPHRSRGRRRLRGGRGQAIPHPPQALSGDLGAGPGHVRGGGRIRDRRAAGRLVGCNLQGLLPLRGAAERRLAGNRLTPAARTASSRAVGRNRDGSYLVAMRGGRI